jgi:hypothetical protein
MEHRVKEAGWEKKRRIKCRQGKDIQDFTCQTKGNKSHLKYKGVAYNFLKSF